MFLVTAPLPKKKRKKKTEKHTTLFLEKSEKKSALHVLSLRASEQTGKVNSLWTLTGAHMLRGHTLEAPPT